MGNPTHKSCTYEYARDLYNAHVNKVIRETEHAAELTNTLNKSVTVAIGAIGIVLTAGGLAAAGAAASAGASLGRAHLGMFLDFTSIGLTVHPGTRVPEIVPAPSTKELKNLPDQKIIMWVNIVNHHVQTRKSLGSDDYYTIDPNDLIKSIGYDQVIKREEYKNTISREQNSYAARYEHRSWLNEFHNGEFVGDENAALWKQLNPPPERPEPYNVSLDAIKDIQLGNELLAFIRSNDLGGMETDGVGNLKLSTDTDFNEHDFGIKSLEDTVGDIIGNGLDSGTNTKEPHDKVDLNSGQDNGSGTNPLDYFSQGLGGEGISCDDIPMVGDQRNPTTKK